MLVDLDNTDRQLLAALQENARLTTGELAQMTGLSQSPCWRRIRRLEDTKGTGKADRATGFADGFSGVEEGMAAGLPARGDTG